MAYPRHILKPNIRLFLGVIITLAAWMVVSLSAPYWLRLPATILLTMLIPGWLLVTWLGLDHLSELERFVLAVGASYALTILSSLAIIHATNQLSLPLLAAALGTVALILAIARWLRPLSSHPSPLPEPLTRLDMLYFFMPVVVAAFFTLTNLAYADYWGDEMNGLLRAISIINGQGNTIFQHTKGPAEILLPGSFGLLVDRFEPFTLRFSFALAHIIGIGGFYLLGWRLFNRNVGVIAALLLTLNGLYLAFGRIVQYQPVVFMMTSLSILLAYHFYRTGKSRYLYLSAFLVGVGLLAHYDMLLVLPPIGYLIWQHYAQHWTIWKRIWPQLVWAGLILGAVVALFYLPFLLHPHLSRTSSYLSRRIVGASNWPGANFDELYMFAVMYNSRYYVIFIALFGLGIITSNLIRLLYHRHRTWRLQVVLVVFLLFGAAGNDQWSLLICPSAAIYLVVCAAGWLLRCVYRAKNGLFVGWRLLCWLCLSY